MKVIQSIYCIFFCTWIFSELLLSSKNVIKCWAVKKSLFTCSIAATLSSFLFRKSSAIINFFRLFLDSIYFLTSLQASFLNPINHCCLTCFLKFFYQNCYFKASFCCGSADKIQNFNFGTTSMQTHCQHIAVCCHIFSRAVFIIKKLVYKVLSCLVQLYSVHFIVQINMIYLTYKLADVLLEISEKIG